MKKLLISFFALALSFGGNSFVFSQSFSDYKNQIKFTPLRMINLVNPGFELSYERDYAKRLSSQISVAYLTDVFNVADYDSETFSGRRIAFEQKIFYSNNPNQTNVRKYFSLVSGYSSVNMKNYTGYFMLKDFELEDHLKDYYEDVFDLKRTSVIINAKTGFQVLLSRFCFDFSIGLGFIVQNITHSNRLNPDDKMLQPRSPNVYYATTNEGKRVYPHMPISLKIGYVF